jgi:hypothetical protein
VATKCEKKMANTKKIVDSTLSNTHSFLSKLITSSNLSVAEKTLQKYKKASGDELKDILVEKVQECWGCKGAHTWRNRTTKEIICPNQDKPEVQARAKKMHKQYIEELKTRRQQWVNPSKIKFSQLSAAQKEMARQLFLDEARTVAATNLVALKESTPSVSTISTGTSQSLVHNLPTILVCSYNNGKPLLPVAIDGALPHITLALGPLDAPLETVPVIRVLYDTGASMSSGYAGFWLPIFKAHPYILEELHSSDNGDYNPIILGGIVTGNDGDMSKHTTALTLVAKI